MRNLKDEGENNEIPPVEIMNKLKLIFNQN